MGYSSDYPIYSWGMGGGYKGGRGFNSEDTESVL